MSKVLLVVDMQNDFLMGDGKLNVGHDTSDFRARVADYVENFDGEVYLSKDVHYKGDCEFKIYPEHCLIDTDGGEFVGEINDALKAKIDKSDEFTPFTPLVYTKNAFSGSVAQEISTKLYEDLSNPKELHVVGVCTHICVHEIVADIVGDCSYRFNSYPIVKMSEEMLDDFDQIQAQAAITRFKNLYGVTFFDSAEEMNK